MKLVKMNQKLHNPDSPLLIEDVKDGETVKEISEPSYIDAQSGVLAVLCKNSIQKFNRWEIKYTYVHV